MWKNTNKYNNMISAFQCDFTCVRDGIINHTLSELDAAIKNPDDPRYKGINEDINILEELEFLLRHVNQKLW